VLGALGGPSVYGIAATPLVDNLLVLAAFRPAVGLLLAELISFHCTSDLQVIGCSELSS